MKVVNAAGVRKIKRDILSLQQSLRSVHRGMEEGLLSRSVAYWDLYERGPKVSLRIWEGLKDSGYARKHPGVKAHVLFRGLQRDVESAVQDGSGGCPVIRAEHVSDRLARAFNVGRRMGRRELIP